MSTTRQRSVGTSDSDPDRDRELARRCLDRISPDCDRDTWVKVGMALRSVGPDQEELWHSWSSGSPKYRQSEAARQWRTFKADGGVTVATLVQIAGLTTEELRSIGGDAAPAPRRAPRSAGGKAAGADAPSFASVDEAVTAACGKVPGAREAARWRYRDDWYQVRIDTPDGKQFRPVSRREDGRWVLKAPEHRTLYRVEQLPLDPDEVVLVVEGEKCADIAAGLGFAAVTCANGAQSPLKADWSPLKGRTVAVLPDQDAAGVKFRDAVKQQLQDMGCTVSVVELPGLGEGDDIEQWRDAHGDDAPAALRELVESNRDILPLPDSMAMLDESLAWCDQHQGKAFVGMPCGVLPKLDRMLDGFRGLVYLTGAPGCGKTSLVLAAGVGVAHQNPDAAVLLVSCEMSSRELMHRLLCMHSTSTVLDWRGLVKGQGISPADRERAIGEARSSLERAMARVAIVEQTELTRLAKARGGDVMLLIRHLMRDLKRRTGCTRGMVVIDNVATLPVTDTFTTDLERERFVTNRLLELQEMTGDAVLVIAQQNKEAMRTEGRSMASVKGAVEQVYAADAVLVLTEFKGTLDGKHPSLEQLRVADSMGKPFPIIRCSVPKGRDGMSRKELLLLFDHERSTLLELDRDMVVKAPKGHQEEESDDDFAV